MKVFNTTIKRMENEQVTKTVLVDDPETGEKKTVEYQTYEWKEKAITNKVIPNTPHNLQVLAEVAAAAGFDPVQKRSDSNIRFVVETVSTDDPAVEEKDIDCWFICGNCNEVEFDITAAQVVRGATKEYRCSACDALLATLTT